MPKNATIELEKSVPNDPSGKVLLQAENDGSPRLGLTVPRSGEEFGEGPEFIGQVSPANEERREFEAWGTIEVADRDDDIIAIEGIKHKLEKMLRRGSGGAPLILNHSHHVVGTVFDAKVVKYSLVDGRKVPAVYITGKVFKDYRLDDSVWKDVLDGKLNSISIGGKSYLEDRRCDRDGKCAKVILDMEPTEWSLCSTPKLPLAKITEVFKGEIEGELVLVERVRKHILDHYREHGLSGKCDPCTELVRDISKGLDGGIDGGTEEDTSLNIAKSMLDEALTQYDYWYGGVFTPAIMPMDTMDKQDVEHMNEDDKKTVQDIVKSELATFAVDFQKSMDAMVADVKKSLSTSTDETKGEVMGSNPKMPPSDASKSLEYSQEYQETVKAEVAKAKDDILKSLSAQLPDMVNSATKEVAKASEKGTATASASAKTDSPVGDVRKSGIDASAANENKDPMMDAIANAWKTGDTSSITRY